tara:strand:- start:263 stop:619 length:357 start_codon:yes stop_codon:yes gene_type:complete
MEPNNTLDIHSNHHANMWQNQSEMWEKHYMGLLEHSQKLVTKSAKAVIRLDEAIEASYEAKNACQIMSGNEREGMLGEMRIHKDIIRHTHGFVGEGMIKELASGEHKTLVKSRPLHQN